ncbi:MAG: hypothetical protein U1E53_04710 [Dongiaceae bacterium]
MTTYLSFGSRLTQSVEVATNIVDRAGEDGVKLRTDLYGKADATQTVAITGNSINDVGENGIYVVVRARGDATGTAVARSPATRSPMPSGHRHRRSPTSSTTASSPRVRCPSPATRSRTSAATASSLGVNAFNGGTVEMGSTDALVQISGNTVTGSDRDGIDVYVYASSGAEVSQAIVIGDNVVDHVKQNGIYVRVEAWQNGSSPRA